MRMKMITLCAAALCVLPAVALGLDARSLVYSIREDPHDAESAVAFRVRLLVEPQRIEAEQDGLGGTVHWEVAKIELAQIVDGQTQDSWTEPYPFVDTPSGLWTLYHANLNDVPLDDFGPPPLVEGMAEPMDEGGSDLEFSFEGGDDPHPGPEELFNPHSRYAKHYFRRGDSITEMGESDGDEPVDLSEDEI